MPFLRPLALAGLLGAACPVYAADALCPDTISVKQTLAAPAPEWTVSASATPIALEMVTFYSGPPKDEASLVYDDLARTSDASVATWNFARDSHGYWVKCSYRGTTQELAKPLPPTLSACRLTYDRQAAGASGLPVIRRIACQ